MNGLLEFYFVVDEGYVIFIYDVKLEFKIIYLIQLR